MAIVRWDPLGEVESLHREMNRLFDSFYPTRDRGGNGFGILPALEMKETDEAFQIQLELPGFEAKDLDIQVTDEAVIVSGERKQESESEEEGVHRSEFRYGKYHRVIPLTAKVVNQEASADYQDGILKLTLPKSKTDEKVHRLKLS
ncbi:Hsp20/alpha crystallin family protein [Lyngbya confervoides]|uniref:Hsp20/alpha crystallin family protein n=1 Tax=Lyngbya confervoides BDU141951 TaxID=1574623 RepID=A0ABD4T3G6_9CYAN|nr:Hsp20/alpha crystallin family protein [Lyngbya confervoides]MCM1983361.1 Hsp20/alpha crystallin family protein [Lyngbya confervoides BDU141951]